MGRCAVIAAAFLVVPAFPASAAPGELDPVFGDEGVVTTVFPVFATAAAIQPVLLRYRG